MPSLYQHPTFILKIRNPKAAGGADGEGQVPVALMDDIAEIVVDSSLHQPDMFTIRLHDAAQRWVDNFALFDFGKEVVIEAQSEQQTGGGRAVLIKGEITALESNFSAQGETTFVIRGYDKSNRLHLGKHSRTFTNQTDQDIVETMAREAGLEAEVDPTAIRYDYVMQKNQTNMDFLLARAQRIGYQIFTIDKKLFFKKGESSQTDNLPILDLGKELRTFRPRMTTAHQVSKVRVRGWDAKEKRVLTGEAQASDKLKQGGMDKTSGDYVKAAFKLDAITMIVDEPISSLDEANALAGGLANDIGRELIEAEGACLGNPQLKAGVQIKLTGLGKRFNGPYFVTSATHIYNTAGYEVTFTVSGRQPNTFYHLLASRDEQRHPHNARIDGVVVGLVTNLNDRDDLGRVKVKFPWLVDDAGVEIESAWAKIASPMAGQSQKGFYCLPEINDEVLIAFEHGDVNRPYVVGVLWNNKDKPPEANKQVVENGKVTRRIIRSRSGHLVILDDSDGKQKITIQSQGNHKIILDDTEGAAVISILDQRNKNGVVIDSTKETIKISATNNLTLEADGPISIKSKMGVSIDGGLTTEIKGGLVKIN